MDRIKTGELIAQSRREKKLTQKELAQRLHVSDRAVSKWERGAGFPDVSLLEPLAAALELNVLDLLRGERTEEQDVHAAVQEALRVFQEKRKQLRRYVLGEILKVFVFLLLVGTVVLTIFPVRRKVDQTITAGVYVDGILAEYTDVEMQGDISYFLNGKQEYWGRFAIGCVEWTCREGAKVSVVVSGKANESGVGPYLWDGILVGDLADQAAVFSANMREFAFALQSPNQLVSDQPRAEKWCVLATSPEMYQAYAARQKNQPPELNLPDNKDLLPDFPSPWEQ